MSSLWRLCGFIITSPDFTLTSASRTRVIITTVNRGLCHFNINKCCFGVFAEMTDIVFLMRIVCLYNNEATKIFWIKKSIMAPALLDNFYCDVATLNCTVSLRLAMCLLTGLCWYEVIYCRSTFRQSLHPKILSANYFKILLSYLDE